MTNDERDDMLRRIAEQQNHLATGVSTIQTHISLMSPIVEAHGMVIQRLAERMGVVEARQEDCPARKCAADGMLPGNRASRVSVWVAVVAVVISLVTVLIGFFGP